ncbi:MAG: hypothetical protein HY655_15365 [Acidobacteria bacterium]|nr:hypothetical protein [Acidobacteriota bacterium]
MNLKRTATIGVAGGALAAWLAAAGTSGVHVSVPRPAAPAPIEQRGAELASEIARLHERLRPTAAPRQQGRNLFQFRSSHPRSAPVTPGTPAVTDAPTPAASLPPPQPPLKLSGVAEDRGPDGPIRTAIISGQGQLFLVKEGEMVTPRYRVAKISADVVELVDVDTNATLRLAMR